MLDQVKAYMIRHNMVQPGDVVLVAVSGGPDSVSLVHALHMLSEEFQLALHVFHMDHGLRGEASAADAQYVCSLARELGLPVTVRTLESGKLKGMTGSLQANARTLRYQELRAVAGRIGANKVALGHNRDDQAETVLMRFLRGAGSRGLSGMAPVRSEGALAYIRPLLGIPRREIALYCQARELNPRLDESNVRPDYRRNKLRLELIPHLAQAYNPGLNRNLADMAEILREENELLEAMAASALDRCRSTPGALAIQGDRLLQEPTALVRRVLRLAAREACGPDYDLGLPAVTEVLDLLRDPSGTRWLHLPGGLAVACEYGTIRFEKQGTVQAPPSPSASWLLADHGVADLPQLGLRLDIQPHRLDPGPWSATFDADRLPGPLAIRFRRPGERLWPVGMNGSKKVQDLLVDAKVPARKRDTVPILVSGEEVLWVLGYRLDRRFLADPDSQNVCGVRILKLPGDLT